MLCLAGHSHVWSSVQQAKEVKGHLGTYAEDVWVQIKCKSLWLEKVKTSLKCKKNDVSLKVTRVCLQKLVSLHNSASAMLNGLM